MTSRFSFCVASGSPPTAIGRPPTKRYPRMWQCSCEKVMDRKFKATLHFIERMRHHTALVRTHFSHNCARFPNTDHPASSAIAEYYHRKLHALHRRYSTSTRSFKYQLLSARHWQAPLHASSQVLLLQRCGVTNSGTGRTPDPGSAQRPKPQRASTDHVLQRASGCRQLNISALDSL